MRSLTFEGKSGETYETLRQKDKIIHKNLCKILKQLQRENPTEGYGKPEALKYSLSGMYSRKISQKDRLIYSFTDTTIHIFAIGGHYGDN